MKFKKLNMIDTQALLLTSIKKRPFIFRLIERIKVSKRWQETATQLPQQLNEQEIIGPHITPKTIMRYYEDVLRPNNFEYEAKRTSFRCMMYF